MHFYVLLSLLNMAKDFLHKKLAGCIVKGMRLALQHKKRFGKMPDIYPVYCEFASAGQGPGYEVCEITETLISEVEHCPKDIRKDQIDNIEMPLFYYAETPSFEKVKKRSIKSGGITHIFVKSRNGYHIMKGSRRSYCRGNFEIMGRAFHFKNMPSSSLCAHCVKAYREEKANLDHRRATADHIRLYRASKLTTPASQNKPLQAK